jgi:hypothetical protein
MTKWITCVPVLFVLAGCGADPSSHDSPLAPGDETSGEDIEQEIDLGGHCTPKPPNKGLLATFDVVGEVFRSQITNPGGIQQAIDLWQGRSQANIPVGRLKCTPKRYNCPYHWHQDPRTIEFAEFAIEVCDGLPSFVEESCDDFGAGSYCPFAAQLTLLQDCRRSRSCPVVPR